LQASNLKKKTHKMDMKYTKEMS